MSSSLLALDTGREGPSKRPRFVPEPGVPVARWRLDGQYCPVGAAPAVMRSCRDRPLSAPSGAIRESVPVQPPDRARAHRAPFWRLLLGRPACAAFCAVIGSRRPTWARVCSLVRGMHRVNLPDHERQCQRGRQRCQLAATAGTSTEIGCKARPGTALPRTTRSGCAANHTKRIEIWPAVRAGGDNFHGLRRSPDQSSFDAPGRTDRA